MTYSLYTDPGRIVPVIPAVQWDNSLRVINFGIEDVGGTTVTESGTAYVYAKKPDGTVFLASECVVWSGTSVALTMASQLTAAAGDVYCVIGFQGTDGEQLGLAPFILRVAENPYNPDGIISTDVFADAMDGAIAKYVDEHTAHIDEIIDEHYGQRLKDDEDAIKARMPLTTAVQRDSPFDVNTLATVGVYTNVFRNNTTYPGVNFPHTTSGTWAFNVYTTGSLIVQDATFYTAPTVIWRRYYDGTTWTDWASVTDGLATTAELNTAVAARLPLVTGDSGATGDFNSYITPGEYMRVRNTLDNSPGGANNWWLKVAAFTASGTTYVIQDATAYTTASETGALSKRRRLDIASDGTVTDHGWTQC